MKPDSPPLRPLWFRMLRGLFFTGILVVTLGALAWAFENWRGERAWQAKVREYAAKGDPLDAPLGGTASVPADQDVFATPLLRPLREYDVVGQEIRWRDTNGVARVDAMTLPRLNTDNKELTDGRTPLASWQEALRETGQFPLPATPGTPASDVLIALDRWKAELEELEAASHRPMARFRTGSEGDLEAYLKFLGRAKAFSGLLQLRSAARLSAGDSNRALADIEFNERWARLMDSEPLMISHLVAIAIETIGTRMAWEGLADHRWNDEQLQRLQALFAARRPRENLARVLRGELRFGLSYMESWLGAAPSTAGSPDTDATPGPAHPATRLPRGWVRQNQISLVRYHELLAARCARWIAGDLPDAQIGEGPVEQLKREGPAIYTTLTLMLAPALERTMEKADRLLTISRMAEIACALERYRLANGGYPETLEALKPTLMSEVPSDPCTGKPFQYRRTGDATFQLYSLGLNGRDDGGRFVRDDTSNDWVWPVAVPMDRKERMF